MISEVIAFFSEYSKRMALICGLLFLILFLFKRKDVFVSFLYLLYAISFFSTSFLLAKNPTSLDPVAMIYLLLILPIFFAPFKITRKNRTLSDSAKKQLRLLADFFVVLGIPAVLFYGYYAYLTITTLDLSVVRLDYSFILPHNIFNTIFAVISTLYFIPLVLYFYFLKFDIYPKLRGILLLSTLSYPLLTLCYAGRDGILFWAMNFVALYLLFRQDIRDKTATKRMLRVVAILVSFFVVVFMVISLARFGGSVKGPVYSFVNYMGQQSIHFSNTFGMDYWQGRGSMFSGVREMLGIGVNKLDVSDYVNLGIMDEYNVFAFFVGQVVRYYGKFGALLFAFLFMLFTRHYATNYSKSGSVIDLLIVFMLFQIPMNGVFYYRQGIGNGDVIYTIFWFVAIIYKRIKL